MATTKKATPDRRPVVLVLIGVGVLALAIVLALTTTGSGTNTGERFDLAAYEDPGINGEALPPLEDPANDPAVGTPAPSIAGEDLLTGEPVTVQPDQDGPLMLLFLAHWCNHCQREVPIVQDLVDAGNLPDEIRLVAVAAGIDENAPNYPPDLWLEGEDWTAPTIVDTDGSLAQAFGLSAYPYWVLVGEDGNVTARFSGALGAEQLQNVVDELASGS